MSGTLSSDILEKQFGPTDLEILWQDESNRIIATKAAASGQVLELSRVTFRCEGIAAFPDIHRQVRAGTSMGKAFAGAAVDFKRDVRAVRRYNKRHLPSGFRKRFGTSGAPTVVEVSILVGDQAIPYADVLEVYSPQVMWRADGTKPDSAVMSRIKTFGTELASLDT